MNACHDTVMSTCLRRLGLAGLMVGLLGLAGCAFQPQAAIRALCENCRSQSLQAGEFELEAYWRNIQHTSPALIHVYLEGDGRPWIKGRSPATNPSSQQLTALRLMMLDPNPSLYLNRPCYGLHTLPANCHPQFWTSGRYSPLVVETLQKALDKLGEENPGVRWLLIGHSGGGTLAMLIAQGREDVAGIITLAANLDTDAWTRHFGYLPLEQSLNPALMPPLPMEIPRWHFAAERDTQVPASLIAKAAEVDENARFILLPGDHNCCWQEHWPRIPGEMAAQLIRSSVR